MRLWKRFGVAVLFLLSWQPAHAARNDVLIIVNDNSIDSQQIGQYYAQQRGINSANIVHVRVPNQYYVTWTDFLSLRDQILRFGICPTVAYSLQPAACSDTSQPIYSESNLSALTANTPIRYLVTTRGVPTRMTVDASQLYDSGSSTSVDNYLKFWLATYFSADTDFSSVSAPRSTAFGDGRGMRIVKPATDGEYIIGRIDGVNLASAKALIDRAIAAEADGVYGILYGSTFGNTGGLFQWINYATNLPIYQSIGDSNGNWRYALGLFAESRPECSSYQSLTNYFAYPQDNASGKTPTYCLAQFNKGSPNETIPGVSYARQPRATNALGYFGSLDGHTLEGGFTTLQNWRKNATCSVTLCANATNPAACQATSTDPYRELATDCVGVAPGFIGYNFQSFPVSIIGIWPTGWGPRSVDQNDVPLVVSTDGADDSYSLWFYQPDEGSNPQCYVYSVTLAGSQTPVSGILNNSLQACSSTRKIGLNQTISTTLDPNSPPTYQPSFYVKGQSVASGSILTDEFLFRYVQPSSGCPAGPPSFQLTTEDTSYCDYTTTNTAAIPVGDFGWTLYTLPSVMPPAVGLTINNVEFHLAGSVASGNIGLDKVSVIDLSKSAQLVTNGSFNQGHQQTSNGDFAANFLSRLGGTAFWGSLSHHESRGYSFRATSLGTLTYFTRGLPLGDAVWLGETHVSGIFYGDPLYSPVAVRFNYTTDSDNRIAGNPSLSGSTINGRDTSKVATSYQIAYCHGRDFYVCDQQQSWIGTGLMGTGGQANQALGTWDTSDLPYGDYTLRLAVSSTNSVYGEAQTFNDYYVIRNHYSTAEISNFFIGGTILDASGQAMPGVKVQIANQSGSTNLTTTTNANGYYQQAGLKNGVTYLVSPTKAGYNFNANSGSSFDTISGSSDPSKDYTGYPSTTGYSVSGTILDANNQPMPGVTVQISNQSGTIVYTALTNINGYYSQAGIANGGYYVQASKANYSILGKGGVAGYFVAINGADVPGDDFTGYLSSSISGYSIAGTVVNSIGNPVPGVTVGLVVQSGKTIASSVTNSNGYYSFVGISPGFYSVSPSMTNYNFNSQIVNLNANATVNFTGIRVANYSISGFVLVNGQPLPGVTVQINDNYGFTSTTTTDSSGFYSQGGLKSGSYIVWPTMQGYSITPTSGNSFQSVNGSNVIDKNFAAVPQ